MTPFNFPQRPCDECRGDYAPRSRTQRYCPGCENVERSCDGCGEPFAVRRVEIHKRPARFCSSACRRRDGGLHFNRKAGRWFVICRDQSKYLYSRAVMSGHVGRLLDVDEQVHHRNEDRTDDRLENLQIVTPSEHGRIHYPKGRKFGWPA